ncbi:MAG: bifunctional diaminohydroxyphosphoribosylaminopyrimidine deaminase/5-amino-6-(5-phosphoribosylamino)uracil reductase RibD [Coriobacteriales bacterium]|jgi:diaminohydroxyphosphoribosylaminopyrimidine deaminase/5-amino-6-(5-phosphoribosylamino)uracil reductase
MASQDAMGQDAAMMRRAIALALRGSGRTNPNPLVGAVIVRDGRIIGQGWHGRYGGPHAEREALADCARGGFDPAGATVYVTLEPCSHTGHQPPCADALVEAGVSRVVVGSADPNPLVDGRGVARLRDAGVEVVTGFMRDECDAINQVFFHYITERAPYVVAKWAMSADGRVACASGDARWVTGELARAHGHALRNRLAAVMVGAGTVRADDPLLTCRLEGGRDPLRVVCDARLSAVAPSTRLARSAREVPLIVACCSPESAAGEGGAEGAGRGGVDAEELARRAEVLRALGVEVLELPCEGRAGRVDLRLLMGELARREVDSVLLEGGPTLHAQALADGLVDEIVAYVAPKVVGGASAPGAVAGQGAVTMGEAFALSEPDVGTLGVDVRLSWRVGAGAPGRRRACVSAGPLGPVWDRAAQGAAHGGEPLSGRARGGER